MFFVLYISSFSRRHWKEILLEILRHKNVQFARYRLVHLNIQISFQKLATWSYCMLINHSWNLQQRQEQMDTYPNVEEKIVVSLKEHGKFTFNWYFMNNTTVSERIENKFSLISMKRVMISVELWVMLFGSL